MGKLKKGSAAAKAWGRKMKRLRSKSTRSTTPKRRKITKLRKRTMPKRRKKATRRSSKTMSIWGINLGKGGAAALYGAIRARASNYLQPYTSKIPVGAVSDEVGMIIATQMAKKFVFKKAGIAREALTLGQAIEFARIGEAVATGQINLGALTATQTNSGNLF